MLSYVSSAVFYVPVYALACTNTVSTVCSLGYNLGYTICVTGYIVCKAGYNVSKAGYGLYKTGYVAPRPEKIDDTETSLDLVMDHHH
jgi:hypothetical protein